MQNHLSLEQSNLTRLWTRLQSSWYWSTVLVPFVLTRLAWILAAAFSRGTFQPYPTYAKYAQQGGIHTRIFLLDIFAHWDAGFYLSIIKDGYWKNPDLSAAYSNVAFYPLYPYLVKSIGWLGIKVPVSGYLVIGLLLSNVCFLAAMWLLYRIGTRHLGLSEQAARRAILLLILFPASFYFSSFYAEGLFLFLSLLGFVAAFERRWWLAGIAGALVTLTRVQGAMVVIAMAWIYMDVRGWKLNKIRWDALWLGLAPLMLAAHFYSLYTITGHWFAPVEAQVAWGRGQYGFLEGLRIQLEAPVLDVFKIDAFLLVIFFACGIYLLRRDQTRALGVYTLLMCALPVSTGLLISVSRFLSVIFPVFLLMGEKLERREGVYDLVKVAFFTLQVVYFAGWANFYWIA